MHADGLLDLRLGGFAGLDELGDRERLVREEEQGFDLRRQREALGLGDSVGRLGDLDRLDLFDLNFASTRPRSLRPARSCRAPCVDLDRSEVLFLLPVGFAELVQLKQRPDGERLGQAVLALDGVIKVEVRCALEQRAQAAQAVLRAWRGAGAGAASTSARARAAGRRSRSRASRRCRPGRRSRS